MARTSLGLLSQRSCFSWRWGVALSFLDLRYVTSIYKRCLIGRVACRGATSPDRAHMSAQTPHPLIHRGLPSKMVQHDHMHKVGSRRILEKPLSRAMKVSFERTSSVQLPLPQQSPIRMGQIPGQVDKLSSAMTKSDFFKPHTTRGRGPVLSHEQGRGSGDGGASRARARGSWAGGKVARRLMLVPCSSICPSTLRTPPECFLPQGGN